MKRLEIFLYLYCNGSIKSAQIIIIITFIKIIIMIIIIIIIVIIIIIIIIIKVARVDTPQYVVAIVLHDKYFIFG